jgi:hypothetical protein
MKAIRLIPATSATMTASAMALNRGIVRVLTGVATTGADTFVLLAD